ncbi:MAG TPA: DinB family protein [Acidimicrobiales bacterium]|jgi:uncharacterized damage-inducible protein DinB
MEDSLGTRRNERDTLEGALDWYRAVVPHKVEGLGLDQARRVLTPTGLSVLGVIKHLAWVERGWFRETFAGEEVEFVDSDLDNSAEFLIDQDDTVESVLAFYRDEVERSRLITGSSSLDDVSARSTTFHGHVSLRWILVHMLEETARHAGHLDIMRETIDGRTGD